MRAFSAKVQTAFKQRLTARLIEGKYLDWRRLVDVVGRVLRDGTLNQGDYEEVVAYVEFLFDEHVKPYDIPGLPAVAEEYVDNLTRAMIRPVVQQLFEQFVSA